MYYQLVHPLTTTVIAPMLVLIILNYFILARVAARRVRRVSSRVTRRMERSQARLSVMVPAKISYTDFLLKETFF